MEIDMSGVRGACQGFNARIDSLAIAWLADDVLPYVVSYRSACVPTDSEWSRTWSGLHVSVHESAVTEAWKVGCICWIAFYMTERRNEQTSEGIDLDDQFLVPYAV